MLQKLKNKSEGFTIIEVLIVLAIAGLIILIVFLAVPALQRNSRNTQRREDTAALLGAVQESINNNNGTVVAGSTAPAAIAGAKLSIYNGQIDYLGVTGAATALTQMDTSKVYIRNGLKCDQAQSSTGSGSATFTLNAGFVTTTGATKRDVVAIYAVETASNTYQSQCQES